MVFAAKAEAALQAGWLANKILPKDVAGMNLQNKICINNIVESLQKDAEKTEPSQEPG